MTFDPRPYVEGLKRANEAEKAATLERVAQAKAEARSVAEKIGALDHDVHRIYLFGSLAEGNPTHLDFDIDLAMVGGDVLVAMEAVEESEFSVDIVELKLLPRHLQQRIQSEGIVLFGR